MTHPDEVFEELREHVFLVAYRMLGSAADAEDLVQEAWIRWESADHQSIDSPRAWLTTVVTRLAMTQLTSARVRREQYAGTWLPEPIHTDVRGAQESVEADESLSIAFLLLLESLTPKERAVFLLHECFALPHARIAEVIGSTEAGARKLLQRARTEIRARRPRFTADEEARTRLLDAFRTTTSVGNLDGLTAILAEDVVVFSDGGGQARAALRPVHGRDKVARFVLGAIAKFVPADIESHLVEINGATGIVVSIEGRPLTVITADIVEGQIQTLYIVTNPDKLQAMTVPGIEADQGKRSWG